MKKIFRIFLAVTLIAVFGVPLAQADLFVSSSPENAEGKIYRYNETIDSFVEIINELEDIKC